MYKAVIFDLDGVICSTDHYHYLAWKMIADKLGLPFDEVKNNRLRGVSRMASLEIVLEDYRGELSDEDKLALAEEKNAFYRESLKQMTPADLPKDVETTLAAIRAAGIPMSIGSSSKNTKFILERIGLGDFFDAISDGTNITKSKPDPEVFLCAAQYLHMEPKDCLVVEDAEAGIKAAIAGGMASAGIGEAAKCGLATYNLGKFTDLIDIVCK